MLICKILYHINAFVGLMLMHFIYKMTGSNFSFGRNVTYRKGFSLMIDKKARVKIGNNCFFNNYCSLNALKGIAIGDGSIFGENVKIYDHNHCYKDKRKSIKDQGYSSASIQIGEHCWIGSNVVILKGVTIGDNVVIGANCIIYKDVPSNTIVMNKQNLVMKKQD